MNHSFIQHTISSHPSIATELGEFLNNKFTEVVDEIRKEIERLKNNLII